MLLGYFKKISEKKEKRKLILILIEALPIDESQKEVYKNSLEIIDDEIFDAMYTELTQVYAAFEKEFEEKREKVLKGLQNKETKEQVEEKNSAFLLLNNL